MAMTAAERMKAMRERRRSESGLKYTEVYVPEEQLEQARERAASEMTTLREVLTKAVVDGLTAGTSHVTPDRAATLFVEALSKSDFDRIDDWRATNGSGSLFDDLVALMLDGAGKRNTLRAPSSKGKKALPRTDKSSAGDTASQGRRRSGAKTTAERTLDAGGDGATMGRKGKAGLK